MRTTGDRKVFASSRSAASDGRGQAYANCLAASRADSHRVAEADPRADTSAASYARMASGPKIQIARSSSRMIVRSGLRRVGCDPVLNDVEVTQLELGARCGSMAAGLVRRAEFQPMWMELRIPSRSVRSCADISSASLARMTRRVPSTSRINNLSCCLGACAHRLGAVPEVWSC